MPRIPVAFVDRLDHGALLVRIQTGIIVGYMLGRCKSSLTQELHAFRIKYFRHHQRQHSIWHEGSTFYEEKRPDIISQSFSHAHAASEILF